MNYKIRNWLYIICSILIIGVVGYLAINLLLILIPVLVVIYIIFKIKGYFQGKSKESTKKDYTFNNKSYYDTKNEDVDDYNSEVIDVDYEDVKK